ncbi:MAG: hypothetical protein V4508_10935 [Pseudomonadota bacterium]
MTKQLISVMQWRCLLVVLGVLVLCLDIWAATHWERTAIASRAGTLGIALGPVQRSGFRPIMEITKESPLLAWSAARGDEIKFGHPEDAVRALSIDVPVSLTLRVGGQLRQELVHPIPDPLILRQPFAAILGTVTNWAQVFITLLLAMLIGWSRADSKAMRIFALVLLNNSPNSFWNVLPGGTLANIIVDLRPLNVWFVYIGFAYFSMVYAEELGHRWANWTRRCFRGLAVIFGLYAIAGTAQSLDALPWAIQSRVNFSSLKQFVAIASVVFSLGVLLHAWRSSKGTARQKLAWAGVCTGLVYAGYLLFNVNLGLGLPIPMVVFESVQNLTIVIGFCALTYAMLRHRLFDFGFVVNRVLVVTIVSSFLLVIFAVTEWGVDKLLHFEGRQKNIIFDAAVALGIILSFHRIQHWVSHQVDHLFFHQWYSAAEKLRKFVDKAPLITDAIALQLKFIRATEEFSGANGMAFYARCVDAHFELQASTLPGAPKTIDENDELAIDLGHTRGEVELEEGRHGLPGAWGFPIMGRGRLQGMFIANARSSEQQYRPDQIALLSTAVRQIGLDLESLRSKEFESRVEGLMLQTADLKQQLKHAEQFAAVQERESIAMRKLIEREA